MTNKLKINLDIQNAEIRLAELNLKKMYGQRGFMELSHNALVALLKDHKIAYPKRVFVVEGYYVSWRKDDELIIDGNRYNSDYYSIYKLSVDENGDVIYQTDINGDLKTIIL